MSTIAVPKSVAKVLAPGEEVIATTTSFYKDFYATTRRVLTFEKPAWLPVLILAGLLPYLIGLLAAGKTLAGSLDYSQIAGVTPRSSRRQFVVVGLVLGLLLAGLGLFIAVIALTSPYKESQGAWVIGAFFIGLGVLLGGLLALRKANFWQIEPANEPGKHPGKWRIPRQARADKLTVDSEFARLVRETAARKGPA
jgi:hypothetical protein